MFKVRASSVPRILNCGPSLVNPDNYKLIDPVNEEAQLGSANHEALQIHMEQEFGTYDNVVAERIPEIAKKYGVSEKSVSVGYYSGLQGLQWIQANMYPIVDPVVEEKQYNEYTKEGVEINQKEPLQDGDDGISLSGSPDLYWIIEIKGYKILVIVDYKLANTEGKMPQLRTYGKLIADKIGDIDRVDTYIISLLDGEVESASYTIEDLDNLIVELHQSLEDPTYRPGKLQCKYCPIRFECKARHLWLSDEIRAFFGQPINDSIKELADSGLFSSIWDRVGMVSGLSSKAKEKVKIYLEEHKEILCGEDRFFIKEEVLSRTVDIVGQKGFDSVYNLIGDAGLRNVVKDVSVSKVESYAVQKLKDQYDNKPPKGSIGQTKKAVTEELAPVTGIKYKYLVKKETIEKKEG